MRIVVILKLCIVWHKDFDNFIRLTFNSVSGLHWDWHKKWLSFKKASRTRTSTDIRIGFFCRGNLEDWYVPEMVVKMQRSLCSCGIWHRLTHTRADFDCHFPTLGVYKCFIAVFYLHNGHPRPQRSFLPSIDEHPRSRKGLYCLNTRASSLFANFRQCVQLTFASGSPLFITGWIFLAVLYKWNINVLVTLS